MTGGGTLLELKGGGRAVEKNKTKNTDFHDCCDGVLKFYNFQNCFKIKM